MATQFQIGKKALADKIRKAIQEFEIEFAGIEVVSINVAQIKAGTDKPEDEKSIVTKPV